MSICRSMYLIVRRSSIVTKRRLCLLSEGNVGNETNTENPIVSMAAIPCLIFIWIPLHHEMIPRANFPQPVYIFEVAARRLALGLVESTLARQADIAS